MFCRDGRVDLVGWHGLKRKKADEAPSGLREELAIIESEVLAKIEMQKPFVVSLHELSLSRPYRLRGSFFCYVAGEFSRPAAKVPHFSFAKIAAAQKNAGAQVLT